MLHLVHPPTGRAATRLAAARVRSALGAVDPDVRRLGTHTGRYLLLSLGIVVLTILIAVPSGFAVQGAIDRIGHMVVDDGVSSVVHVATVRTAPVVPATSPLQVHVQLPTTLPAGAARQFRVAVTGGPHDTTPVVQADGDRLLTVEFELQPSGASRGLVSVTPSDSTVTRHDLVHVAFQVEVDASVACGTDLGHLLVRVVDTGPERTRGQALVALPPVDCSEPPPTIGGR